MITDPNVILERLQKQLFGACLDLLKSWTLELNEETGIFIEAALKCLADLRHIAEQGNSYHDLQQEIRILLNSMLIETKIWKSIPAEFSEKTAFSVLEAKIEESVQAEEEFVEIEFDEEYWERLDSDKSVIRAWKLYHRFVNTLGRSWNSFSVKVGKLFGRSPSPSQTEFRRFHLQSFLSRNISIALAGLTFEEFLNYLHKRAQSMDTLHRAVLELSDKIVPPEPASESCVSTDLSDIRTTIEELENRLNECSDNLKENYGIETDLRNSFEGKWIEISREITERWNYAGTPVYPGRRYKLEETTRIIEKNNAKTAEYLEEWNEYLQGIRGEWLKDLQLSILQVQILQICAGSTKSIEKKARIILPIIEKTGGVISDSIEKFNKNIEGERDDFRRTVIEENRTLLKNLRQKMLPEIMDAIVKSNIEAGIYNYKQSIKNALDELSDTHVIFTRKSFDGHIPDARTDVVPLKELAYIELFLRLQSDHSEFATQVEEQLKSILRSISEIDQVVEFNLEAALNLLKETPRDADITKPKQVVADGLERTVGLVRELTRRIDGIKEFTAVQQRNITLSFLLNLKELLDNKKINDLKIRLTRAKAREQVLEYRRDLWRRIRFLLPRLVRESGRFITFIRQNVLRIRKLAGLSVSSVQFQDSLTEFFSEADHRIAALPYVYQRLFRTEPLEDERFFGGRDTELNNLTAEFNRWRKGYFGSVIVTGEKGTGKTTLMNIAEARVLKGFSIVRHSIDTTISSNDELLATLCRIFGIEKVESFDELTEKLMKDAPQICIIENLNNLYVRSVGGFDALEQMLLLISVTGQRIFWITSCSIYSWNYLDSVLNISRYFSRIIQLGALSRGEIENIIMKRHRVSGYEVTFGIPDEPEKARKYKKLNSEELIRETLQKHFFDELTELASGNILVAMHYWLRAISDVSKGMITVSPLKDFDSNSLLQLSADDLFNLAAILVQGGITEDTHARVFRTDRGKSRLVLRKLKNSGLLLENNGVFSIHALLYRPVVRALKSRNIIH